MQKLEPLKIGVSGNEFFFSENAQLVEYIQTLYPRLKFDVNLSLSQFPQRNLHDLVIQQPHIREGLTYESLPVQDAVVNGLLDFFDKTQEEMMRSNIKSATVHLSRIDVGTKVSPIGLKTELYAQLRACFIADK